MATLKHMERMLAHLEKQERDMPQPVTRTTEEDDVILRFLSAAGNRVEHYNSRVPINSKDARAALRWLTTLVGKLNDDGTIQP